MDFTKILAVSGTPGLFKFVAQGKAGIIVESLADGHRTMVSGAAKVSSLSDIAIYTQTKEVPLGDLFQSMYDKSPAEVNIDNKSTPAELTAFMESILPDYDRDQVHNSDIKKIGIWYNILVKAGMTKFKVEEEATEEAKEDTADTAKTAAKAKTEAGGAKKPAAVNKPIQRKVSTSGAKVAISKSTSNRKSGGS